MKKTLLTLTALTVIASALDAQTKTPLYEEFTGENCAPCAASNPALEATMTANPDVIYIRYQSPIPSAGPIYLLYPTDYLNREPYYYAVLANSTTGNNGFFAPSGFLDGKVLGIGQSSAGHVGYCSQAALTAEKALTSSFNMTAVHAWNTGGDSVTATITVNCVTAFAPASANMKLRVALIEDLNYATAPGTNGEIYFPHVVRRMYPDGTGTAIANAWTMGQSQTFTIKGYVPSYVDKQNNVRIVAFLENDNGKIVEQAAQSALISLPTDIAATNLAMTPTVYCTANTVNVPTTVTLKNASTTTITAAKIFYKIDDGAYSTLNWTGSLATGATADIAVPLNNVSTGYHVVTDSVSLPNGINDVNAGNGVLTQVFNVYASYPMMLPHTDSFGPKFKTNWMSVDLNNNGATFAKTYSATGGGHSSSKYFMKHANFDYPPGEVNMLTLPKTDMPTGPKYLDFYLAYRRYSLAYQDTLDIVYSTDCGSTWNTVWTKFGSDLATGADVTTSWAPTSFDWAFRSIDVTSVPTNSMIGFRAKSGFGNNLYIDDVNLHAGFTTSVKEATISDNIQLYPNPTADVATLILTLRESSDLTINVTDALGRTVISTVDKDAVQHIVKLNTSSLANGIYNVRMQTNAGIQTVKLTVTK